MSSAHRRAEFFALEALEYLGELEPLVRRNDTPDLERLVRGARALRGAALMAGLGTFARAAAGLESVARQVRDHALGWDGPARDAWREGLQTLRGLVAAATRWEAADDRQSLALAERLERVATGRDASALPPPPQPVSVATAAAPGALTPGVRAFIARESELIATSLLEASRALAPLPPADALTAVLERMRSLRGLGAAGDLSPLPELLEAMEATTRSLLTDPAPPPNVAGVFADAADALHEMARSVADDGRVLVPNGLDQVATRLLRAFTSEADVVTIDSLGFASGESIVTRGSDPATTRRREPVPIELVGMGDYLASQADALDRQASPATRDLRLFVLHRTLATMPTRSGTGQFLAPLIRAILRAIAAGDADSAPDRFTALLHESSSFLVAAADRVDSAALADERDRIAHAIGGEEPALAVVPEAGEVVVEIATLAPEPDGEIVAIESLAPEPDGDIVAIESLAPEPDGDIVAIESLAPEPDGDIVAIESLAPEPDDDIVTIESLAPDAEDDVVPIEALAPTDRFERLASSYRKRDELIRERGTSAPSLEGLAGDPIVSVDTLLYRGQRALHRAEELRGQIAVVLSGPTVSLDRLRPLVDELLDLVPLARDAA